MNNIYKDHIKEVCEIVDSEIKRVMEVNDRHSLLTQTVKYKIMSDLCHRAMIDNYEGLLDSKQVQEMLDTFVMNVTNIVNIEVTKKSTVVMN